MTISETGITPKSMISTDSHGTLSRTASHGTFNEAVFKITKSAERKHSHYFKDVSNLKTIDVYRVIDLFDVTNSCIQHALKKLLVAGGRGAKNVERDIQEAIDTLIRYQEMKKEDGQINGGE